MLLSLCSTLTVPEKRHHPRKRKEVKAIFLAVSTYSVYSWSFWGGYPASLFPKKGDPFWVLTGQHFPCAPRGSGQVMPCANVIDLSQSQPDLL